jgi:hypothetical protein
MELQAMQKHLPKTKQSAAKAREQSEDAQLSHHGFDLRTALDWLRTQGDLIETGREVDPDLEVTGLHIVEVTGDRKLFRRVNEVVYDVAEALKVTLPTERVYLMSLGSHQGNAHVHWHVAPLPPGVPYERQQFHAVMAENGVLEVAREEQASLAARLRFTLSLSRTRRVSTPRVSQFNQSRHFERVGARQNLPDAVQCIAPHA